MRQALSGIYQITCKATKLFYIGSSCDLMLRFYHHKRALNGKFHYNCFLQEAWIKYGYDNFLFDIVMLCPEEELIEKEQYYLDSMLPYERDIGFNINKIADPSESRARWWTISHPNGREEVVFSLTKFCRNNGLSQGNMTEVAKGSRKKHKGYSCRPLEYSKEEWEALLNKNGKPGGRWQGHYIITKPDGTEEKIFSLSEYCKKNSLGCSAMVRVANGKKPQYKGYKCRKD